MPYILSEDVQRVAADNKVVEHVNLLPERLRPNYLDILTFADLVAKERAKVRGSPHPTADDYFIALAWTCMIPWSPPKPPQISPKTRARFKSLLDNSYVSSAKREAIRRALQRPLITLSKQDMNKGTFEVTDMVSLPP